jgi:integrase/recombinase XerD
MAETTGHRISKLALSDLSADNVRAFLTHLESRARQQYPLEESSLAMLHTFFAFVGGQAPELLHEASASPPSEEARPAAGYALSGTREVDELFAKLPLDGRLAVPDRAFCSCSYTIPGHGPQKLSVSRSASGLGAPPRVNLHGKGDKWRTCPFVARDGTDDR